MAVKLRITLAELSTSITGNYSRVRTRVYADSTSGSFNNDPCNGWVKIDGTKYSFKHSFAANTTTLLYELTRNINHNSQGRKTLYTSASFSTGVSSGTITANKSLELTNIPRQSIISKINPSPFIIEDGFTISITKYSSAYKDNLTIKYTKNGSSSTILRTMQDVENGEKIVFTTEEIDTILSNNTQTSSVTFTLELASYSGSTLIGKNSKTVKGTITNANPIFTNFDYNDINPITLALTNNPKTIIKGKSEIQISNVVATSQKGSTLKYINAKGTRYSYTENGTYDIGIWEDSSQINIFVEDSRNLSTNYSKPIETFIDYIPITKNSGNEVIRTDNIKEETKISFSGSFFNGNFGLVDNSLSATYKYKIAGSSDENYVIGTSNININTTNEGYYNFDGIIVGDTPSGFNISNSYDIVVTVVDKLSSTEFTYTLNSGIPAIAIYKNNCAIHGEYDESLGGTQINGDVYLNGNQLLNLSEMESATGNAKIGILGIEWGIVSVKPEGGYGSISVNLKNNYKYPPLAIACAGVGYSTITNVGVFGVTTDQIAVFMTATNDTARTCRYLVIGKIQN